MATINVVFVATGPVTYNFSPGEQYDSYEEMYLKFKEMGIPELFDYVLLNNLVSYYDDNKEMPSIWMDDLPRKYWKYFTTFKPTLHDLDRYDTRQKIAETVKKYYPNATKIKYETVDDSFIAPTKKLQKLVSINDENASKKYGITFKFQHHYKERFQEFLKKNVIMQQPPYDMIWFIGACNPHFLIDLSNKFRTRFRTMLKDNGYICYMDSCWLHNYEMIFLDMETRLKNIKKHNEIRRIKALKLIKIETGIHQFDRNI